MWRLIHGVRRGKEPLDNAEKSKLLSKLRNREHCRQRALVIARRLGWEKFVEEVGGPHGKQAQLGAMRGLQANGCFVRLLVIQECPDRVWASAGAGLESRWASYNYKRIGRGSSQ